MISKNKLKIKLLLLNSVLPLVLGFLIYLLTRKSDGYFYIEWINIFFSFSTKNILSIDFPNWISVHLTDAIWAYSFISTIQIIWIDNHKNRNKSMYFWLTFAILLSFTMEILQKFTIVPGTYDLVDLIYISIGMTISVLVISIINHGGRNEAVC